MTSIWLHLWGHENSNGSLMVGVAQQPLCSTCCWQSKSLWTILMLSPASHFWKNHDLDDSTDMQHLHWTHIDSTCYAVRSMFVLIQKPEIIHFNIISRIQGWFLTTRWALLLSALHTERHFCSMMFTSSEQLSERAENSCLLQLGKGVQRLSEADHRWEELGQDDTELVINETDMRSCCQTVFLLEIQGVIWW